LRLAVLLAHYLYQHKSLELPGLGTFVMNPAIRVEDESGRSSKNVQAELISFKSDSSVKESPELIAFISAETGKIKALASADLDSHLQLAEQFLNIGKPFTFEGIGTIVKIKAGEYTFTPGTALPEFKKESQIREHTPTAEEIAEDYNYKNIFYPKQVKSGWKKPAAVFLLVAGLGLAIWGGYAVYKNTIAKKQKEQLDSSEEKIVVADTTPIKKDTIAMVSDKTLVPPGNYKFILETTNKERAIPRFNKLKTYQWNVLLETKDSLNYKIYMLLAASASDTSRIRDSLTMLTGKKVYIE
jgi:hypothetical protein